MMGSKWYPEFNLAILPGHQVFNFGRFCYIWTCI